MELEKIELQLIAAAEELITIANPQKGQVFVVGCSTSEVVGSKIGTAGSMEAAEIIFRVLQEVANKHEAGNIEMIVFTEKTDQETGKK